MGAETQLLVLMGVNHSKLFIKFFLQCLKSRQSFVKGWIRIRIEKNSWIRIRKK